MLSSLLWGSFVGLLVQMLMVFFFYLLPRRQQRLAAHPHATPPQVSPQVLKSFEAKSKSQVDRSFAKALLWMDAYSEKETALWLNAILARLYCQWWDGFHLSNRVAKKLNLELQDFFQSWLGCFFIDQVRLLNVQLAPGPPILKSLKVFQPQLDPPQVVESWVALTQWTYAAGTTFEFNGHLMLNVPFHLEVEVKNLDAKVYFRSSRKEPVVAYAFLEQPTFDLSMVLQVNQQRAPQWLHYFLEQVLVPAWIWYRFVLPSCKMLVLNRKEKLPSTATTQNEPQPTSPSPNESIPTSQSATAPAVAEDAVSIASSTSQQQSYLSASTSSPLLQQQPQQTRSSSVQSTTTTSILTHRLKKGISTVREQYQASGLKDRVSSAAGGFMEKLQEKRGHWREGSTSSRRSEDERTSVTTTTATSSRMGSLNQLAPEAADGGTDADKDTEIEAGLESDINWGPLREAFVRGENNEVQVERPHGRPPPLPQRESMHSTETGPSAMPMSMSRGELGDGLTIEKEYVEAPPLPERIPSLESGVGDVEDRDKKDSEDKQQQAIENTEDKVIQDKDPQQGEEDKVIQDQQVNAKGDEELIK